jgi:hypothetical protein
MLKLLTKKETFSCCQYQRNHQLSHILEQKSQLTIFLNSCSHQTLSIQIVPEDLISSLFMVQLFIITPSIPASVKIVFLSLKSNLQNQSIEKVWNLARRKVWEKPRIPQKLKQCLAETLVLEVKSLQLQENLWKLLKDYLKKKTSTS